MNGFERHGILHSSPSALNMWAAAPDAYIAKYLFGHKFEMGVAALVGNLVEEGLLQALLGTPLDEAIKGAESSFNRATALVTNAADRDRVADIAPMLTQTYAVLKQYGKPELPVIDRQHKVELTCKGDGWTLPVIGYLDFKFPEHGLIIDLKTTRRMPSTMSIEHKRQQAIYQRANGNLAVKFLYVTPKKCEMLSCDDINPVLDEIKILLNRQERFLSLGDKDQLKAIVPLSLDSYYWTGSEHLRKELYGI